MTRREVPPVKPSVSDRPTTYVYNLDAPLQKPRVVRLSPRAAVAWCYVDSIGQTGKLHVGEPHIYRTDNGWICGSYWARDDGTEKQAHVSTD